MNEILQISFVSQRWKRFLLHMLREDFTLKSVFKSFNTFIFHEWNFTNFFHVSTLQRFLQKKRNKRWKRFLFYTCYLREDKTSHWKMFLRVSTLLFSMNEILQISFVSQPFRDFWFLQKKRNKCWKRFFTHVSRR